VSKKKGLMETVLAVGDLHAPFMHKDAVPFLKAVVKKVKPTKIVIMGDELDMHALSNFEHDPDGLSAGHELEAGIEQLQPIYRMFPKADVCTSNHTARPFRQAYKHGIPKAFLRDYKEFTKAPSGWRWGDGFTIDDVIYEHGEGFTGQNGAIKAALGNMSSTVIGHIHSFAGIQYSANPKHLVFGFNVGCLIDKDAYAFAYGKKIKSKPIIGVGVVDKGIPTFLPMLLDKHGRWKGKL
jgi:hypothetical protein